MVASVTSLERIAQGREAEIFAWGDGRVLRLFRRERPAASLEHEAAAMRAARSVLPSVPEVFGFEEVERRQGIVMERVEGPDYITLLGSKPWLVWSAGDTLGRLHAALHEAVAPPELQSLKSRLQAIINGADLPAPDAALLRAAVDALPDGDRVCHGDFHPGNVIKSDRGPVVIDWPNAAAGDPAADFARTDLLLVMGDPPPGTPSLVKYMQGLGRKLIRTAYRRAYLAARPTSQDLVARWQIVRIADRLYADRIDVERERLTSMLREAGLLS
jgi:aminoglycoside phosphotransferase (APT) family kinase protein